MQQTQIGHRLRTAREQAHMSQQEAASQLGFSPSALSQYETGKRKVDALTLDRLARLYGVSVRFFFGEVRPTTDWEEALRQRSRDLPVAGRKGVGQLIDYMHRLEELYERLDLDFPGRLHPPFPPLPERDMSPEDIETYAERVRRHFDLGTAPLLDVKDFMETQGFLVFGVPFGEETEGGSEAEPLSGLFFTHSRLGPVVTVNTDQYYGRASFTLAHELAHGFFHHDRPAILCRSEEKTPSEQFASQFAARFLTPREALLERLQDMGIQKVTAPEEVVRLARYFGVSYLAMYYRLRTERRIREAAADFQEIRPVVLAKRLGYAPSEHEFKRLPWPLEDRLPKAFITLAYRAAGEGVISVRRAAEMLGISVIEFEERLDIDEEVSDRAEAYG